MLSDGGAKSAGAGLKLIGVMLISGALSGITAWAWSGDWFRWFGLAEAVVAVGLYVAMHALHALATWESME